MAAENHAEPRLHVVCALIEDQQGRVLICQRPEGKAQAGLWEFPGGKVEAGESPEEALLREIDEELGCEIVLGEALSPVEFDYPKLRLILSPYRARIVSGQKASAREHADMVWCPRDRLETYDFAPADIPILKEL